MDFSKLSSEQQLFCNTALNGNNVRVEACIGSGKTTAIQTLCDLFPKNKLILYLTYNKLLKVDAKSKIKNTNVIVTNYHGFVYPYLLRNNIHCSMSDCIRTFTENRLSIPRFDILIIDEYQDIELDFAYMLEYIKSTNPNMQIIMVGDMSQKIYDKTTLDVENWSNEFLGNHIELEFTQCFRLQPELAAKLGRIWGKTIVGVNNNCNVRELSKKQIISYLKNKKPSDILCLGAKTGDMADVLNTLEERYPDKFNKKTVYARIKDGDANVEPDGTSAIFTTFDSSKGMEKPICIVFDWDEAYWKVRCRQPDTDWTILRNIFCVAASRGKNEIIFATQTNHGKNIKLLSEETLMTPVKTKSLDKAYVNEMFDFKFVEEITKGYDMLEITKMATTEKEIEMNDRDGLIDLSPCIREYQKAVYFNNYNIDTKLAAAFEQRERKVPKLDGFTAEQKLLQLVSLLTKQNRYYNQVKLPFVTPSQHNTLMDRLDEQLNRDEETQVEKQISINDVKIIGTCDALRPETIWMVEFRNALRPEDFLQAGINSIIFDKPYTMLWNTRTNELYKVAVDPMIKNNFITQVYRIITKKKDAVITNKTVIHSEKKKVSPKKTINYKVGDLVEHKRYGIGTVVETSSTQLSGFTILTVFFDDYGHKKIREDFVLPY